VCLLIKSNIVIEYVKLTPANADLNFLHHISIEHFGCGQAVWLN